MAFHVSRFTFCVNSSGQWALLPDYFRTKLAAEETE